MKNSFGIFVVLLSVIVFQFCTIDHNNTEIDSDDPGKVSLMLYND